MKRIAKNKAVVKALTAARPYIDSEEEDFICHAIHRAYKSGKLSRKEANLGQSYILRAIAPRNTLESWRWVHGLAPLRCPHRARLLMIDTYIEHLEAWIAEQEAPHTNIAVTKGTPP